MSLDRIWLVTTPRTASNLLVRILAADKQPNTVQGEYFFQSAFDALESSGCLEKARDKWTDEEMSDLKKVYQERFNELEGFEKSQDKRIILKEHVLFVVDPTARIHSAGPSVDPELLFKTKGSVESSTPHLENLPLNVTVLPDEFLASWFPVFLIRHPAIIFPSYYRTYCTHWAKTESEREAMKGEIQSAMSLRWVRSLYNWYMALWEQLDSKDIPQPIILDAEDFMADPEIIARFCDVVGLDRSKLQLSWEAASKETLENTNPGDRRMKDTLLASTGIDPEKIKREVSLEEEMRKWEVEFGEAGALELADWVKSALPDYEFLRSRKFT